MFRKGSKIYAMITGCCPKCHEESMYLDANPFNIMKIYAMHETCSHCKQVYKIEPSFFFGAMFVSYGLGVLIGIITFLVSHFVFQANLKTAFISIIVALILSNTLIMRMSRNIWINIFVHFDKNWKENLSK
ncbi:DUF983 domain-containing protein [Flavobacterium sp.]|jgi:uncharacterized protein (DUF983 family)|uniref:DUF983 domain-containing protein n=1 Tax=Flavobacterium sp. TaxID=239 RepID=UPI0037C14BBE